MPDRTIKQHDTFPPLKVTLSDASGAVNLSTATAVKLIMKSAAVSVTGTMTVDPDQVTNKGVATYTWVTGDTATSGTYNVEFEVTWTGGKIETFPNSGYLSILIQDDLG